MTGKLELEYEGELKGADNVVREIIRAAVARTYDKYFHGNSNMNQVVQWFDLGGEVQMRDSAGAQEMLHKLRGIQGLLDKLSALGAERKRAVGDAGLRSGVHPRRPVRAQENRTQRGAHVHRGREAAETREAESARRKTEREFRRQEGRLIRVRG